VCYRGSWSHVVAYIRMVKTALGAVAVYSSWRGQRSIQHPGSGSRRRSGRDAAAAGGRGRVRIAQYGVAQLPWSLVAGTGTTLRVG
jgi:hypothetical protein